MRLFALLLVAALAAPECLGQRMQAKCSACRAVMRELADRLDKEKPRNHLDMRHRLDKHGNRYGKVIDYKLSELRIIELLEGLCDSMKGYEFVAAANSTMEARWARTSELGANRNIDRVKIGEEQKLLGNYCHDLIERHEDEVAHAIQNAEVDAFGISDYLCYELSKQCDTRQQQEEAEEAAGDSKQAAEEALEGSAAAGASDEL